MNNIEGNYEEILEDLDGITMGVQWWNGHGVDPGEFISENDDGHRSQETLNFGLFAIVDDEQRPNALSHVSFKIESIWFGEQSYNIEDPENTHKIVF